MERTFAENVGELEELRRYLFEFCEEVAYELRRRGLRGRTVTIKARFASFKTVTRTRTMDFPTNLGPRLYATARELLDRVPRGPLRLLGVQVSGLDDVRTPAQGRLWGDVDTSSEGRPSRLERHERTTAGLDRLRKKYGRGTVVPASQLDRGPTPGADGRSASPRRPE